MDWQPWLRFAHILGGFTFVLAHGVSIFIALKLRGERDPVRITALPEKGLRPGSVRYLKGLIGLNSVYPFYTAHGLAFTEAVKGIYESGATLIVLDYGTAGARAAAWLELRAYLERSDRFKRAGGEQAGVFLFQDGKGRQVAIAESGPRLVVGVSPDAAASLEIVNRAR